MKRVVLCLAVIVAMAAGAVAQKIDTETSDRTRIVHLKTALNHLTVIEVSEPVVQVATGSAAFKVEWRDNKVFVQPTESDAATNLFIWTASQRLNYELEPASSISAMDFAVDQAPVQKTEAAKPTSTTEAPNQPSLTKLLLQGKPVRLQRSKQSAARPIEVWISDLYQKDGQVVVRYAVRNHSDQPYSLSPPLVYQLEDVRAPQSLYGLANTQLAEEQAARLKSKQETAVRVLDAQLQQKQIEPGQEAVGAVTLELTASAQPSVLRFQFPSIEQGDANTRDKQHAQIAVFLVR